MMQRIQRWRRPLRIALEIGVGFAVLVALDRLLTGGTGFGSIEPSPYWLPVLLMALAYGTLPALVAAGVASALWIGQLEDAPVAGDYLDHLFHLSLHPLLWFVAAVAIGELTMLRGARYARLKKQAGTATRNVGRLTDAFDRLSRTNRTLQVQIATEERTIGHVIATAARLSATDPADRRAAITQLIAMAARTEDFTCYRFAASEAQAWLFGTATTGHRDVLPKALVDRLRRRHGLVHVARRADRAALEGIGVAAIPLQHPDTGEMAGCLVLHSLPFAALSAHRTAELTEIGAWLTPLLADATQPGALARATRPTGLVA